MRKLRQVVNAGVGLELDTLGALLQVHRYDLEANKTESDASYRNRLLENRLVQLLLNYDDDAL